MAAESELLDAKSQVQYFEIQARSILNRTKPNMPFQWTINPYRGCEFGCQYCYARYTHEFMGMEDSREFEEKIYAKAAAPRTLRRELAKTPKRDGIAIGTATDPYQPAERRFGRTRAILEVFADEKGRALSITTKSDLIARDIPLLVEIGRRNGLSVNLTITTLDADLARLLEPRAPRPDLRLATVAQTGRGGHSGGRFPESHHAVDHRYRREPGPPGGGGAGGRGAVLRRRAAIPHAQRAKGVFCVPGARIMSTFWSRYRRALRA